MIVAGGGIIGLSCAWRLAQRGVPVTIFDARETGGEASWAGAGMLSPGDDPSITAMGIASLGQYSAFVEELQEVSGFPIDYCHCGEEALVDPRDVTAALRIACLRAGVKIHEHEAVLKVLDDGGRVLTGHGEYIDDAVLIAAGAWSSSLSPAGAPHAIPVRGHLIAFDGAPVRLGPRCILRDGHTYVVQRQRTGRIIAGSSTEFVGFDRAVDTGIVADIQARAARLLPALAGLNPSETWNGLRPGLENASAGPAIGRVEGTRIWMAYGHYRNGILLAPETARIIASQFDGDGG